MLIKWVCSNYYLKRPKLTSQIDTSNITNAFVSGMKEDLSLYGNQYNYIVLSWTIGYIIGQWVCRIHLYVCQLLLNLW
jgi:hypothetical protein